ncbi:S1 family peptidase [Phytohabitans kaempferiae]|uniref:S1 family peptidase n=1 Tax=Phytohabitans kaempferiae TaxID=1620943 RepID=A0ABV6M4V7_9ACTN
MRQLVKAALAASLGATLVAAVPAPARATPYPAEFQAAVDAFRQAYPGVGAAEAARRIDGQADRVRLLEGLSRDFPGTFGGSWYDGATGIQHVQATTTAAASTFTTIATAAGVPVRAHLVSFSYRQLRQEFTLANDGAHPVLGATAADHSGIDVQANRVVVALPAAQVGQARAALASRAAGAGAIEVLERGGVEAVEDACHDRRNCGRPIRGGIILWRGSYASASCSLGFTASAADGSHWAVTAGHCGAVNTQWGHGERPIGPMRQVRDTGSVDVGRIRIDSSYWKGSTWGWLYNTQDREAPLSVDYALSSEATIQVGETVCLSAWHSTASQSCGIIAEVNDASVRGMVRVTGFDACPGDSGGGWFMRSSTGQRWAYGIHSRSNNGCHVSGGTSWFSSLPDINAYWDSVSSANIRVDTR